MSQEKKIEKIVRLMQGDDSVDAPSDSVTWAKNLYLTRERKPSLVRRIVAVLQADLLPNRVLAGERSASAAQARQMFFTAGDHGVDLRISGVRKGFDVKGQILGADVDNAFVSFTTAENSFETRTNDSAMFEFAKVPAGSYNLTISKNDGTEIIIETMKIGL